MSEKNMVDSPDHYGGKDNPYEVINVIEAWGFENNAYRFNSIKYLARAGKKDPSKLIEDLKKGKWYLDREISKLEKEKAFASVVKDASVVKETKNVLSAIPNPIFPPAYANSVSTELSAYKVARNEEPVVRFSLPETPTFVKDLEYFDNKLND